MFVQWAAVTTCVGVTSVPVQEKARSIVMWATYGYSPGLASLPPTMAWAGAATPRASMQVTSRVLESMVLRRSRARKLAVRAPAGVASAHATHARRSAGPPARRADGVARVRRPVLRGADQRAPALGLPLHLRLRRPDGRGVPGDDQ